MSKGNTNKDIRRVVDIAMTLLLLFLMAYQVTGEKLHEWIGMAMTLLVLVHQVLNRKWYSALFKGRYNPYRTLTTALNMLLLLSFALTAFCGMSMSSYAVPFLYGMAPIAFVRQMHLSMSHWSFVLMGLHMGVHIPVLTSGFKGSRQTKTLLNVLFLCLGAIGLWFFLQRGIPGYLFFQVPFAFLDYDKAGWWVLLENLLMLSTWTVLGALAARLCTKAGKRREEN